MGHVRLSRNLASSVKIIEISPLPSCADLRGRLANAMRTKRVHHRATPCAKSVRVSP